MVRQAGNAAEVPDQLMGTRAAAANETKQRITRAAYHAIARSGALRVSMQEIADQAGVSKGLIHYHFSNKNELVTEALLWALRATEVRILERLDHNGFATDPIAGIVDAAFVGAQQNRDFYLAYLDVIEHVARVPELGTFSSVVHEMIEQRYVGILRDAHERGLLGRSDFVDAATDMRLIIDGTFVQWLLAPDWQSQHRAFARRCERLLRTVLIDQTTV